VQHLPAGEDGRALTAAAAAAVNATHATSRRRDEQRCIYTSRAQFFYVPAGMRTLSGSHRRLTMGKALSRLEQLDHHFDVQHPAFCDLIHKPGMCSASEQQAQFNISNYPNTHLVVRC